jgi:hypothetical protein
MTFAYIKILFVSIYSTIMSYATNEDRRYHYE